MIPLTSYEPPYHIAVAGTIQRSPKATWPDVGILRQTASGQVRLNWER